MATIPSSTTSLDLKDKGISDLTGLQHLPSTVTTIDLSNDTSVAASSPTGEKNTFKSIAPIVGLSTVTSLKLNKTMVSDFSQVKSTVTTFSATDLTIEITEAKRLKKGAADATVVPNQLVKVASNISGSALQAPTEVKFGQNGTLTAITNPTPTAASITLPTQNKDAGDYTLTFKFTDNGTAANQKITGTLTKAYKIVDPTTVDKAALTAAVEAAEKLQEADYTAETWAPFNEFLTEVAKLSLSNWELITQEEVDEIKAILDKLEKALVKSPIVLAKEKYKKA